MSPLLRVLMLVDGVADVDVLMYELRHTSFELDVRCATTEAAYLAALESPLDLIVADNALPAFDAMRALQILRTSALDIPLIVVTESAGEAAAIECVLLGAADFLFKDRPGRLRSAVIRALDQRELRRQARAADAARHTSAAINQQVLDALPAHIALLNATGVIVAVNQAWERFARANGDLDGTHTGVGINYLSVCETATGDTSAEAQPVAHGIAAVLARELEQFTLEYLCHSPDAERWFLMRVTPLVGEQTGAVVMHADITVRKHAEAALRESEERFRSAYDYAAIGMALVGLDGRWLQANHALCDFIGYTEPELQATTFQALTHPDDLALDLTHVRALVADEIRSYQMEKRYVHKDGTTRWALLSVSLVRDAQRQPRYFVSQIQDITERRQAEATRVLLAAIVDASDDAIIGIALDGTVLSWNNGATQLYGYRADQMLGQPIAILWPPHGQDEATHLTDRLARGETTAHFETVRRRNDGQLIAVALTISAIYDAGGTVSGFSTTGRDISARIQADQTLHQKTAFIQLLQDVAVAANQSTSLDHALQTAVDTICMHIGWPVGHVYLPDPAMPGALLPTHIWHLDDAQRFATFRTITEAVHLAPGIGLPGQVVTSRKPAWIADMIRDDRTPRTRLIQDIGVRAGFALPVLLGDEVVAVLEFFATAAIAPDAALLEVLQHVGTQLGRVVERARAETALRESEARFRVLFTHSPDAIMLLDPHHPDISWPIVECNAVACQMNGYTHEQMIGQSIDLLNPVAGSRAERVTYLERLRRDGAIQLEVLHRRNDGSLFPIEIVSALVVVAGHELVLGIDRDISARKHAEEALRAAEAQYRTLVEQIPAIIYTAAIDARSSTSYVSPQIETILGFSPKEWLADPQFWLTQVHPDDRAHVLESVGRSHDTAIPLPVEYRSSTRDGRLVWLRDTTRVVRDDAGQPLFIQGIALDITERKQAELALQISAARFRAVWESAHDAMVLVGPDGMVLEANPAYYQLYGYTSDQIIGQPHTIIYLAEQRAAAMAEFHVFFRAPQSLTNIESIVHRADGTECWIESSVSFIMQEGQPTALLSLSRDITERKHMEVELINERALLARRVAERTADLSAANAELARTAVLKDEFLASMSHELRTPLNAVLGLSEALQEEVYGPLNDRQSRSLHSIEESGRHLLELINDILDLAKIGAGKLELEREPTPIATICQASLRLITQLAHQKHLSVDLALDPAVRLVDIDARRVKQILVNLLSNAVKFTPEGGSIGLEVTGDVTRQTVDLTIWDTGIGIAHEHMSTLFQPFVQLDSRLARQYEGTGLGLALVYRMVELHGGSIAVTSDVGRGSRFTVALPWHTAHADMHERTPAAPDAVAAGRTIMRRALIVEDSPTTANQITRYLHELAIASDTVREGTGVVARVIAAPPDLILLDLLLPESSGWDVLAQLKAEPRTRAIPVVILSSSDERARGLALGAADYLVKPVARADLERVLSVLAPNAYGGLRHLTAHMIDPLVHTDPLPLVLLAEDNEATSTMIADYLGTRGYQVVVARNGAEAIAQLHDMHPALVLMDIQMPGMDGLEAMRRIRASVDLADLPIIALTALAMPGDRERCIAAGASAYLSKPVSLRGLASLIAITLQTQLSS